MIYNEQKLASFARKPFKYEREKIIKTHEEVRKALSESFDKNRVREQYQLGTLPELDVFLQGSYKNDTDVTKTSDVDLVVRLETVWQSNKEVLDPSQLKKYNEAYSSVNYSFSEFNADIFDALKRHFGPQYVLNDNKCLKIKAHDNFCDADVIPCLTYRRYGHFVNVNNQNYDEGMYFVTNAGDTVVNYPKLHYDSLVAKSTATNGVFKETVRVFKNIKDDLIENGIISDDVVKSYFIENMLYNVPSNYFQGNYTNRFLSILDYLIEKFNTHQFERFVCANGIDLLCSSNNWSLENVKIFLIALIKVRDESKF